ncbi:MAG: 2-oxo acid dehydrogenase subunit E2 [Sedimentisphaeraceae bacterium JB056]
MDKKQEKNKIELTNIQKVIGKRMVYSKRNQPCFYINMKADITNLSKFRRKASRKLKARLTTNDFFFMAMSNATCEYPLLAGRIKNQTIEISKNVNIGFAVAGPDDKLFVPVVKATDKKNIAEIANDSALLTQQAKAGKLTLQQMSDATIALSGLGMFGIEAFIAILPPDMPSILAIGKPEDELVVIDGDIKVRKLISLTLAVDRRIVSPDYAAKFLNCIKTQLENPETLI